MRNGHPVGYDKSFVNVISSRYCVQRATIQSMNKAQRWFVALIWASPVIRVTEREHLRYTCGIHVVECVSGFMGDMTKSAFPEADKQSLTPFLPHFLSQHPVLTEPQGLTELGACSALGV